MKLTVEGENHFSFSSRPTSLLERSRSSFHGAFSLSALQKQVDGIAEGFISQATDWKSLAALMAGGMAYRLGRMGVMSSESRICLESFKKVLSIGMGLATEVSAFETTHRALIDNQKLWRWSGSHGLKQGLSSSFIAFGTLKGLGRLAEGQNIILQHVSQDLGLVLGHQLAYGAGMGTAPTGTLAEQFLRAEATNLQVNAAAALGHGLTGGELYAMERGQDLAFSAGRIRRNSPLDSLLIRNAALSLKALPVFLAASEADPKVGKAGENPIEDGRMNMNISTEQGLLIASGVLGATVVGAWLLKTLLTSRPKESTPPPKESQPFYTPSQEERELLKPFFPKGVPPALGLREWEGITQRVYDEACEYSPPPSGKGLNFVIKNRALHKLYFRIVDAKLEHLNGFRKPTLKVESGGSKNTKPHPSGLTWSPHVEIREAPTRSTRKSRADQETLIEIRSDSPPKKD